ncbi:MAG: hypothetical protein EOP36_20045 [Rubrivivax sp.]|nr:MAG: hypothetical protein EOP36_20045 [Rubrivivax sp.]
MAGALLDAERKPDWRSIAANGLGSAIGSALGDAIVDSVRQADLARQQPQVFAGKPDSSIVSLFASRTEGVPRLADEFASSGSSPEMPDEASENARQAQKNWDRATTAYYGKKDYEAYVASLKAQAQQHANAERQRARQVEAEARKASREWMQTQLDHYGGMAPSEGSLLSAGNSTPTLINGSPTSAPRDEPSVLVRLLGGSAATELRRDLSPSQRAQIGGIQRLGTSLTAGGVFAGAVLPVAAAGAVAGVTPVVLAGVGGLAAAGRGVYALGTELAVNARLSGSLLTGASATYLGNAQSINSLLSNGTTLVLENTSGAMSPTNWVGSFEQRVANSALMESEIGALQRIGANNKTGSYWGDLRQAYQRAGGQVDFSHIEADIDFSRSASKQVMGGHFSSSPKLKIVHGTEEIGQNGSMRAQVELLASDGSFYPKTNGQGYSTMTPQTWSLAQAKGEMSLAWLNRSQVSGKVYQGSSSGVEFKFFEPNYTSVNLWRGYPEYTP